MEGSMANQYTGSFEHVVQTKCQCTALELLKQAEKDHLSYYDIGQLLGLKQVTVRKWAARFGIRLTYKAEPETAPRHIRIRFEAKELNEINFLSRSWA
jgi:hypothetical protein